MDSTRHFRQRLSSWLLNTFTVSLVLSLGALARPGTAQPPPEVPATPLTLEDCVRIGLERQPAVAAAPASLAAAEAQRRALDNLCLASLVSRELPIRRKQAGLGVTIASAGYQQAEWETTYAVTRNYFTLLYARQQEQVARSVVER